MRGRGACFALRGAAGPGVDITIQKDDQQHSGVAVARSLPRIDAHLTHIRCASGILWRPLGLAFSLQVRDSAGLQRTVGGPLTAETRVRIPVAVSKVPANRQVGEGWFPPRSGGVVDSFLHQRQIRLQTARFLRPNTGWGSGHVGAAARWRERRAVIGCTTFWLTERRPS